MIMTVWIIEGEAKREEECLLLDVSDVSRSIGAANEFAESCSSVTSF